ncbi:MAG: ubiquinone/menaquinone biosynthesis C-methylase UbiE [Pseudohongiellaceae bacterium]|jgi:ubiquinone/menaquinone biosynthesis C-methylase UbiE
MNIAEFDRMFEIEETHWWYRGRRALVRAALDRYAPPGQRLKTLDLACATGMSFRFLADRCDVRGIDISEETIRLCAVRGIDRIVRGDALSLPFAEGSFDLVLALDAFEHFKDDVKAMGEVYRVLAPGGLLVVTVPAFMALWSPHDEAYHHFRRYRRAQLRGRLESVGFECQRMSYSSMVAFLPVWVMRRLRSLSPAQSVEASSDFSVPMPKPAEWLADMITQAEIAVEKRVNLPFGVSLYGVLRKPLG